MRQYPSTIDPALLRMASKAEEKARQYFPRFEGIRRKVFYKVLQAFQSAGITEAHLKGSSGYGLGDFGRDGLENVYAAALDSEDALVRLQIVSGTHAISAALLAHLNPGERLILLNGTIYPSLQPTIDFLQKIGVYVDIFQSQKMSDFSQIGEAKVYFLQRSRGYSVDFAQFPWKEFLSSLVKKESSLVIIDNCYSEFVAPEEPTFYGADLICGSLIKNPGGGLVLGGGYIAGKRFALEPVFDRIFAPGLKKELGATEGQLRYLYQGLYFAPFTTCEALKGAIFSAYFFQDLGFEVSPLPEEKREDIIQAIILGSKERLLSFAKGIQKAGAIDSQALPIPQRLPGYEEEVLMAGGTFVTGASLELSFDAPFAPPYIGYLQGGLIFDHSILGSLLAAEEMRREKLLP